MKKFLTLALFLSILIFPSWVHADGPYLNIPPTNAFDKIHSDNGTVDAVNFSMPLTIKGFNGINVTSDNGTHTINILNNASCLNTIFSDETSNRSIGTVYQNLSGHSLIVLVWGEVNYITGAGQLDAKMDPTNPPTTIITSLFVNNGITNQTLVIDGTLELIVPNGYYYELSDGSNPGGASSMNKWTEYTTINICGAKGATGATGGVSSGSMGTYNETLANNTLINSGGYKINYINGTGDPVHVVNSNSGQQVNITINGPTFTTRTIDLSSSAYNTVIDNNTGTISITATTKPSTPQFVQTISSGNIPTDTTDVQDYTVVLTVGGKNTNATTAKAI